MTDPAGTNAMGVQPTPDRGGSVPQGPADPQTLSGAIAGRTARVGVIGLGYVGLPLAASAARAGFCVTGFDIDPAKPPRLNAGHSYIDSVPSEELARHVADGRFEATGDLDRLADADVIVICVPTPLTRHREPDLSFVETTAEAVARTLRPGQLVSLESTSFPGTTDEVVRPILERSGLASGRDFFLAYSPEREDPGSARSTASIPKVVAGDGEAAAGLAATFYGALVEKVVPVSSTRAAEAVKITENVFRAVNIALVNELKTVYDAMGVDVWEVIDAAATKPFGYMPFYPGPGLGGHCIPIDPFYLTWKAREYDLATRFVELAGEVNLAMPAWVIARLERALDETARLSLGAARILLVGLAYKKNVSDVRESPSLVLMERLEARGATVAFHDPHVPAVPPTRQHRDLAGRSSQPLTAEGVAAADAILIATDHDAVDYRLIGAHARLVVDTRNAMRGRGVDVAGRLVLA
jgi:UDP-N-acetyl-D-glucosamine dehydrogenase